VKKKWTQRKVIKLLPKDVPPIGARFFGLYYEPHPTEKPYYRYEGRHTLNGLMFDQTKINPTRAFRMYLVDVTDE